jgi:hypothetical protein
MTIFSELLATETGITVVIKLRSITDNGVPGCGVKINQSVEYYNLLLDCITITKVLPLLEPFDIEISMFDKRYSAEYDTAVIIESITIDDFNVIPKYTHLAQYTNDHDYRGATSYLGFNGVWRLSVNRPFYQWQHQVTNQGWLLT